MRTYFNSVKSYFSQNSSIKPCRKNIDSNNSESRSGFFSSKKLNSFFRFPSLWLVVSSVRPKIHRAREGLIPILASGKIPPSFWDGSYTKEFGHFE